MAENLGNGIPNEDRSPKSGPRMAAEGMPFPWRWNGGMISANMEVIWEMSVMMTLAARTIWNHPGGLPLMPGQTGPRSLQIRMRWQAAGLLIRA